MIFQSKSHQDTLDGNLENPMVTKNRSNEPFLGKYHWVKP